MSWFNKDGMGWSTIKDPVSRWYIYREHTTDNPPMSYHEVLENYLQEKQQQENSHELLPTVVGNAPSTEPVPTVVA